MGPVTEHPITFTAESQQQSYIARYDHRCDEAHINRIYIIASCISLQVPELGGATTFTKADVFVKPEPGMATFFSYKDIVGGKMDDGFTEHSGCPVLRGEKWITTVWMREGVTEEESWEKYDPSGIEIMKENQKDLDAPLVIENKAASAIKSEL
jgi:hypothetical protein